MDAACGYDDGIHVISGLVANIQSGLKPGETQEYFEKYRIFLVTHREKHCRHWIDPVSQGWDG